MKSEPAESPGRPPDPEQSVQLLSAAHRLLHEQRRTMAEQKATAAAGENPVAAVAEQSRALAEILAAWRAAPELQSAGLLLPWWMNGTLASEAVERACGERVAFLCREHQRIMQQMPGNRWRGKPPVLRRIKHFMLAYRDPDLAFLGAADLWRRFQAVQRAGRAEQRAHAAEASQVLSPLLDFLGMRELKETVDNWLLSRGDAGRRIGSTEQEPASHRMFQEVRSYLAPRLPRAQIIHRENAQSHNSHHGALHNTDPLDGSAASQKAQHILDVLILVPNTEACYQALHQLHTLFTPIDDSFRDFIGQNRLNGYRALHTGVVAALQGKASNGDTNGAPSKVNMRVNFAICTPQMDEVNRWGLAALHLRDRLDVPLANTWWHEAESAYRQIESAPLGSLPETLYVFSPQGQLFRFHRGCTVVDFAYHVHSELAAHCRRFYVNGETVEPATVLHHLDLVELEYDPHGPGPTRVWLNAARTSRARSRIDRYLKRQGQGFYHGQKTVDIRLKALEDHYGFNIPEHRVKQALSQEMRRRNLSSMEDLMAEVAAGRLVADKMLHPLFADEIIRQVQIPSEMRLRPHQLHLAQCCRPRLGDDIVGRPYVRDGVVTRLKLHRADCGRVQDLEGNLPLKWRLQPALKTVAQLELRALDDDGLLGDALTQIYSMLPRVTLHRSEAVARNGMANVRFVIEAESKEVLDEIADALRRLPDRNVDEVRHMRLPLSEQEELVRPVSANGINPYTRLPVQKQGMFFGRSKELQDLYDWLRADVGVVWLLGQKRVGKTSLLLHLKNEFLDRREFLPVFVDFQLLGDLGPASVFFEIANAVYGELQGHGHVDELGAPLRNMFEHDPPGHLISYLRGVQSHPDVGRVVLLLDEFSRTTDAYQQERLDESFFQQCRGLIGTLGTDVNFVIVVQQQAFDGILQRVQGGVSDPSWHLMELGERLALKPLEDKDARHLIEWPMRNYLDFSDAALTCVYELTGGSPFLIQAFCFKLVSHMVQQNKRRVEMDDIERVSMEFMSPNESVFAHLLDLIRGVANTLCTQMAQMAEDTQTRVVRWEQLVECFPQIPPDRLRRTLRELCERDVLVAVEPDGWQFACLLFQRWLAFNSGVV